MSIESQPDMKKIVTITAIIIILPSTILNVSAFQIIYYAWLFIIYIYSIFKFSNNLNILGTCFLSVCFFSLIVNSASPIFQPWYRFFSFILLFLSFGPFNNNYKAQKFRKDILTQLLNIIVLIVVISFFAYFTRQRIFFKDSPILLNGIFNHSMLLGPIAAISAIYSFFKYNICKKNIYMVIGIICSITTLMASSRVSIIGLIISLLYLNWKFKKNSFSFWKKILAIVIILIISFPLWKPYAKGIIAKQEYAEEIGSFTASRNDKWENRIYEIKSNPIFGIGFASVDPVKSISDYNKNNGTIEPGSSWLFIPSSIGIIGLILIALMFFNIFKNHNSILLKSLLIFFVIHMGAEGYVFATGSLLCAFLWLLIGCTNCVPTNLIQLR